MLQPRGLPPSVFSAQSPGFLRPRPPERAGVISYRLPPPLRSSCLPLTPLGVMISHVLEAPNITPLPGDQRAGGTAPFHRRGNQGPGRMNNLPQSTQTVNVRAKTDIG